MAEKNLFQWGPYQEAALESGLSLFGNLTTQVEKITRLQLEAGAEATREALTAAQALIEIKDPAELGNWQTTYWQPGLERVADTVRKQYDLLAESRSVVLDAIKEASAEATQQVQAGIDRLAEQAPEGFGPVFEAIRNGLAAQITALESVSLVSDQINGIAEANVVALKNAVKPVIAKPAATSKRKAA
ncbi:phasin family protein [Zoogloea sp.]|uniref:phasin family protein n=1 Tax=Zoogloea sp. TaxID=49181 RepID=UPI001DCC2D50|nr:phasin family protein [Zoogloea sp.]MBK6652421.1 phasin family protein [Zoogloea sp.]